MKAHIVVDLGFGDSGKGITTDSLCIDAEKPCVVRYAGGQQCGHTVYLNEHRYHIHSNFGSGTLRGVPSYFSEHCTMYLNTLVEEYNVLRSIGVNPNLTLHPLTMVTTPFDVAWNRFKSSYMENGTVGLGVGATMHRHLTTGYKFFVQDFAYPDIIDQKLNAIENWYLSMIPNFEDRLKFIILVEKELEIFNVHKNSVSLYYKTKGYEELKKYSTLIFEGSQGVMLDMDHGTFPNVTYANTTTKNAELIIDELQRKFRVFSNTRYHLVCRAYTTRHGNGWLPKEGEREITLKNTDMEINQLCEYQGVFRVAPFNPEMIDYAIRTISLYSDITIENSRLVITCLDQIDYEDENEELGLVQLPLQKIEDGKLDTGKYFDAKVCDAVGSGFIAVTKRYSHISSPLK